MLEVTFVRRRGRRDRVYVSRSDGSSTAWDFPSYGDGLPHDLCHLVVEDELQLTGGFWGLVDRGVEVGLVNNEATLLLDGRPWAQQPDVDVRPLMEAEAAVAAYGSPAVAGALATEGGLAIASVGDGGPDQVPDPAAVLEAFGVGLPSTATPDAVGRIRSRLTELAGRWRTLPDPGTIVLSFPSRGPGEHAPS